MTSETILSVLFLLVSTSSALVQSVALIKLRRWHFEIPKTMSSPSAIRRKAEGLHHAMVRTAASRTLAALVYVGLGIITLIAQKTFVVLGLVIFSFTQIMFQANSFADVRLRKDLERRDVNDGSTSGDAR